MEVRNRRLFVVLGDGPIVLGAIAPAILEGTKKKVLIVTRKDVYESIKECSMNGALNETYPLAYASEEFLSLNDFLEYMENSGIYVGIVSVFHIIFKEVIAEIDGGLCFSACREGLSETYLPLIADGVDKPTDIISFDNDKNITEHASGICCNPCIHIHKGVIHSSCVLDEIDYHNNIIKITCGLECILIFPPDMAVCEKVFPDCSTFGRSQWIFTKTEEEYEAYLIFKLATINAIHSFAAVKAFLRGATLNMTVADMVSKRWEDIISMNDLLEHSLRVQGDLYDKYLAKSAYLLTFDKEACQIMAANFIKSLYKIPGETLGRALNPTNSSFTAKVETHFPLLRNSGEDTNEMLDNFLSLL